MIRIGNVKNDFLNLENLPVFVPETIGNQTAKYRIYENDILFTMTGTKGKRDYFFTTVVTKQEKILLLNQRVGCLRSFSTELNMNYLSMLLKGKYILDSIFSTETGNVSQGNIGSENTLNLFVALPPYVEQQRIVKKVNSFFDLLNVMEERKRKLQDCIHDIKVKILDLAIHGKLVPQDPNDEPASELLKRINPKAEITCDNPHYRNLPKGWAAAPMQMLCSLVDGEKQSGVERINLDVKFLRGEREAKALSAGKYVAANTLLILVDGENSGEVFRTPFEGYQGSTFKQLAINDNMYTDYVLQVINLHRKTLRENKVGSAIPHLNKKLFKAIDVPIPPYEEQQRIVNAINEAFTTLNAIAENL